MSAEASTRSHSIQSHVLFDGLKLLGISVAAIIVHGYHPMVEDAAIYVPGIKRMQSPDLYPRYAEFFASHAGLTLFPRIIADSVRLTALPLEWVLLGWHVVTIMALLCFALGVGRVCFPARQFPHAAWGGVLVLASLLTLPVAGTALYIVDEYLNPRSLSTAAVLLAVLLLLRKRWLLAALVLLLTATVHPLMTVFGFAFAACWWLAGRNLRSGTTLAAFAPLAMFPPVTGAYREALQAHAYFFLSRWEWYEWLGLIAPVFLFWWFGTMARRRDLPLLARLCRACVCYGSLFAVVSLFTIPAIFERFLLLQPMRSLHLLYVLLLVVSGGLLGQFVMQGKVWRWAILLLPMCGSMYYAQRQLFSATPHLELPGAAPGNAWVEAFLWARDHTPKDAVFALDPEHMARPGEDQHGFRAIAERSMLADGVKDEGAITMFPRMAEDWHEQVAAQKGWRKFQFEDFQRLKTNYGVDWVVLEVIPSAIGQPSAGLACEYRNQVVTVCRIP